MTSDLASEHCGNHNRLVQVQGSHKLFFVGSTSLQSMLLQSTRKSSKLWPVHTVLMPDAQALACQEPSLMRELRGGRGGRVTDNTNLIVTRIVITLTTLILLTSIRLTPPVLAKSGGAPLSFRGSK